MIYQAIGIGIVVSFAFYEIVGLSPGGSFAYLFYCKKAF